MPTRVANRTSYFGISFRSENPEKNKSGDSHGEFTPIDARTGVYARVDEECLRKGIGFLWGVVSKW